MINPAFALARTLRDAMQFRKRFTAVAYQSLRVIEAQVSALSTPKKTYVNSLSRCQGARFFSQILGIPKWDLPYIG